MNSQPSLPPASQPPDSLASKAPPLNEVQRAQASAWRTILHLPNNDAVIAAQKVEGDARALVIALDPQHATEAEMRCTLAAWKHARELFTRMSSFEVGEHKKLEAAEKAAAAAAEKPLDKNAASGTMD